MSRSGKFRSHSIQIIVVCRLGPVLTFPGILILHLAGCVPCTMTVFYSFVFLPTYSLLRFFIYRYIFITEILFLWPAFDEGLGRDRSERVDIKSDVESN
jgi:hypothetical protein